MKTTLTTELNHFDRSLHLFDVMVNGVFSFKTVLEHHKRVESFERAVIFGMPDSDGVVFLCEHPKTETILRRIADYKQDISDLTEAFNNSNGYARRVLDTDRYRKKCRLQLLTLCYNHYKQ